MTLLEDELNYLVNAQLSKISFMLIIYQGSNLVDLKKLEYLYLV
jgi:hypothetical protein